LISRQQAASNPDPFNPVQTGWALGGGVGVQGVQAANASFTPTLASYANGGRQLTRNELRQLQRGALQTVPISDNE
jgi:hypothetical protein